MDNQQQFQQLEQQQQLLSVTRYWVPGGNGNPLSSTNWSTSSGGPPGASVPMGLTSIARFDGNSGSGVVTVSSNWFSAVINCAGFTGTFVGSGAITCASLVLNSAMSWSYTGVLTVNSIVSAGKTISTLIFQTNSSALLSGPLTVSGTLTLPNTGSFNSGSFAVSAGNLVCGQVGARTFTFNNSTITLNGAGNVWDLTNKTSLTFNESGSTIVIADTSGAGKTFAGVGETYSSLTIAGSAGPVTFTGNNTFTGTFTSGASPLVFTGTTHTFIGSVDLTGCQSITGGAFVKTSGTVTMNAGGIITGNTASGGATFDANGCVDGGGNSGWVNFAP